MMNRSFTNLVLDPWTQGGRTQSGHVKVGRKTTLFLKLSVEITEPFDTVDAGEAHDSIAGTFAPN
jgi:hypothetical protein